MSLNNHHSTLPPETREAISAALEAMAAYHSEVAASSEKVVAKMSAAARVLGWPQPIISGMATQIESVTKMQIQMINHMMQSWEAQLNSPNPIARLPVEMLSKLQSWPGLQSVGQWPNADAFKGMSANPAQFWTQMGEQWQKNWAHVMTQWTESSRGKKPSDRG